MFKQNIRFLQALILMLSIGIQSTSYAAVSQFTDGIAVGGGTLSTGLVVDVTGRVGATEYCDENGANCTLAASLGGGLWTSGAGGDVYYNGGAVGIGTTNPTEKLVVLSATDNVIQSQTTGIGNWASFRAVTPNRAVVFGNNDAADTYGVYDITTAAWRLAIPYTSGNVGIGAQNPSEELHVFKNQANPTTIVSGNTSTSTNTNTRAGFAAAANGGQLDVMQYGSAATGSLSGQTKADAAFIRTSSGSPSSKMVIGNGGNVPLHLITNDTTRMTVLENGNVGIGTTTTRAEARLQVYGGEIALDKDGDDQRGWIAEAGLGGIGLVGSVSRITSPDLYVTNLGDVGIGTTVPSEELHVFKSQANPTTIVSGNTSTSTNTNTRAGFAAAADGGQLDVMQYGSAATGSLGGQAKADAAFIRTSSGSPSSKMVIGNGGNVPLHLITNDATRMTVLGNGNVGIGTTNPTTNLQIGDGTVNAKNVISLGKRVTSSESNLPKIGHDSFNGVASDLALSANSGSGGINFYTGLNSLGFGVGNNNLRMRIDVNGNMGIGDTTPDGTLKLDVEGQVGATEYCDQNGANCTAAAALGSGYWNKTGTDVWYNPGAVGEVGIGLSNPSEELVVNRSANNAPTTIAVQNSNTGTGTNTRAGFTASSNGAQLDMMAYGSGATGTIGGTNKADGAFIRTGTTLAPSSLNVGTGGAQDVNLFTNDTTRVTVDGATGNVGIGTQNPGFKLEVGGSALFNTNDLSNLFYVARNNSASEALSIGVSNSTVYFESLQDTAGDGSMVFRAGENGGSIDAFSFQTDGQNTPVNRFIIEGNGEVGIGTISPTEELHVFKSQANPTTIVAGNTSSSTNTNTRAGFAAAANGGQLDVMQYGSAATGSLGDQTKADAAFIRTSSGSPSSKMVIGNGGNVPLHLITNDTTRMTVLGNGNVGVGTTNPIYSLDVGIPNAIMNLGKAGTGAPSIRFRDVEMLTYYSGKLRNPGGVVIGSASIPDASYLINVNATGTTNGIMFREPASGVASALRVKDYTTADYYFDVNTIGEAYFAGNVGIGDKTPDGTLKLDVEGQIGATEYCDQNGANCTAVTGLGGGKWLNGVGASEIYYSAADIGIGTNSPARRLHLSDSGASEILRIERTGGSSDVTIGFFNSANSMFAGISNTEEFGIGTSSNIDAAFFTVERNGEVGIGTVNPTEELHVFKSQASPTTIVSGNTSTSTATNTRAGFAAAADGGQLSIYHAGSAATGNVADQTKADAAVIRTTSSSPSSKMVIGNGGNVPLHLITNDATRMTVLGNGNVGIGILNPNAALDVSGKIEATSYVQAGVGSGGVAMTVNDGYGNANLTFNHVSGQAEQNGNAGRIEVNADSTTDGTMYFEVGTGLTSGIATSLTSVMALKATGNVGIGTTSPSEKLHLAGSATNLQLTDTDTGADTMLLTNSTVGGAILSADQNNEVAGSYLGFSVDGTENGRFDSAGAFRFAGNIRRSSGQLKCPTGQFMVGFDTAGIMCQDPTIYYQ